MCSSRRSALHTLKTVNAAIAAFAGPVASTIPTTRFTSSNAEHGAASCGVNLGNSADKKKDNSTMTTREQFKYAVERARYEAEVLRQLREKFELARPQKSEEPKK
tara:strand:+ start:35 stop:349 length:315 start_codon:yes stop_codon:yes gene_type:complete